MNAEHHETRVLPAWLYPAAFWLALPVLLLSLLLPDGADLGVWFMMAVPAVAALVVVVTNWGRDRNVSLGALIALIGLGLVVLVRALIA
ncbi:hypothetical protein DEDE109153_06155 [Deinococcus deserti]|uniref:Uncharacterized protein n=1 Tax=Deinococcus deserti (strain DSM 17065 / CIP 109153 / LMG 22923 / VCD115) TaxID=546414 RepID=C1CYZ4_DEIDV|nr:hypothetical protein [Deinococcus deserti]ACO47174.1 conserved hypothetical protein; putative membrane protein [Deinococcus deserti VCD115]